MAFLPSLQEPAQSSTGRGFLYQTGFTHKKELEEQVHADLPSAVEASWGLCYSIENNFAYGTRIEGTGSGFTFIYLDTSEKERREKERSIVTIWQSQGKAWEIFNSLLLSFQDLLVIRQLGSKNNILAIGSSQVETWKNFFSATMLVRDSIEAKEVLEDTGTAISHSPTTDAQALEHLYTFRKRLETQRFLEANRFLIPILGEAYTNIRRYFSTSVLFLEVVSDPEVSGAEQLVLFIAVDHDPDAASDTLAQLDEDWWLEAMERAQDRLCITLEFR